MYRKIKFLGVVAGFVTAPFIFGPSVMLYGFVLTLVMLPFVYLIGHDFSAHNDLIPRNSISAAVVYIIYYWILDMPIAHRQRNHIAHHRYWASDKDKDPTFNLMNGIPWWKFVFLFANGKNISTDIVLDESNPTYKQPYYVSIIDRYAVHLIYSMQLLLFYFILPTNWFVALECIAPVFIGMTVRGLDYYFHGFERPLPESPLLIPFFGNSAWHIMHHENWTTGKFAYGPGNWKYVQPQWYLRKLLFK